MSLTLKSLFFLTLFLGVHLQSATITLTRNMRQKPQTAEKTFLSSDDESPSLNLRNAQDLSYSGLVGFGKNSETGEINYIPVTFDTGSSFLWAATEGCKCDKPGSGVYFDIHNSGFKSTGKEMHLSYGEGKASGPLGSMTVYLNDELHAEQYLVAATQDSEFSGMYSSGIFGLSRKYGSDNIPTLMDNLYEQGKIDSKVFTVSLRNEEANSLITIGEVSHTNVIAGATFTHTNLLSGTELSLYYSLNIEKIQLGSSVATNHKAIADTGTSLLAIPPEVADPFFKEPAFQYATLYQGTYVLECSNTDKFPSLEFTIGGTAFEVKAEQYILPLEENYCQVGIMTYTPPNGLIVLGDIFLRTVVAVFDLQNETIGFAPATTSA